MELPCKAHETFPYAMCFPPAHPSTKPAPGVPREAGNHRISDSDPPLAPASLPAAGEPRAQQVAVTLRLRGPEEDGPDGRSGAGTSLSDPLACLPPLRGTFPELTGPPLSG